MVTWSNQELWSRYLRLDRASNKRAISSCTSTKLTSKRPLVAARLRGVLFCALGSLAHSVRRHFPDGANPVFLANRGAANYNSKRSLWEAAASSLTLWGRPARTGFRRKVGPFLRSGALHGAHSYAYWRGQMCGSGFIVAECGDRTVSLGGTGAVAPSWCMRAHFSRPA
jgi:hypothetical protein